MNIVESLRRIIVIVPYIIAYNVQPRDHISVLSSISAWLGQSQSSGARKGAEQCSDVHSYRRSQEAHQEYVLTSP